uniref:Uncharacterized protein n=1 Tax=Cacopsylla melanoneura TaxID=428564 RepID=A0A8D8RSJ0_9HEMI
MDNSETSWSTDERSEEAMANYWIDQMIDSYQRTAGLRHNIQTLAQISEEQNEITETQNQMREALQQAHQQRRQALQRRRQARQQLRENERTLTEWQRQFFVTVLDTQSVQQSEEKYSYSTWVSSHAPSIILICTV